MPGELQELDEVISWIPHRRQVIYDPKFTGKPPADARTTFFEEKNPFSEWGAVQRQSLAVIVEENGPTLLNRRPDPV
jgi:hypothetical protein